MAPPERIAGVDEAGRGALAGPVVAAAVVFRDGAPIAGVSDSKTLRPETRRRLAERIREECDCWAVGIGSVDEIDRLNILQATMLAMKRAVERLERAPELVLVDGNRCPEVSVPARHVIKGDSLVAQISAASILAKVCRDGVMRDLARMAPEYGFDRHFGYGTARHLESLRSHGASRHHRRSFAPVRNVLENGNQP